MKKSVAASEKPVKAKEFDRIVENWMETQKAYEKEDPKMVYYMSMEFLMGRALGNNLINLKAYKPVAEALEEL